MRTSALLALLVVTGCPDPPKPPPVVPSDASDAAPYNADASDDPTQACVRLAAYGCALGRDPYCPSAFRLPGRFGADPACVLRALPPTAAPHAIVGADLRSCNVTCQP